MKILYVVRQYDYGMPEQGFSTEHYQFYDALVKMNNEEHEVIYFPYDKIMAEVGVDKMNDQLVKIAYEEKPDLCFFIITTTIKPATIQKITERFTTINWFIDDHYQFESTTRHWAPLFTWSITNDFKSVAKYHELDCKVIMSPLAYNHFCYEPLDLEKIYDVTFIGLTKGHSDREWVIKKIKEAGIDIKCWGFQSEAGRVSHDEMVKIISQSKINLCPTMCSKGTRTQIKGRNFEVPGCRGFMLSERAEGLEKHFKTDKEMVCYSNVAGLIENVRYYLKHDKEREAIADAGHKRALKEHTYQQRFNTIFSKIK